jgi:sigma-B regulation protein RsbU (phosphoserine phosphatase)
MLDPIALAILDAGDQALCLLDSRGHLAWANAAAEALLGIRGPQLQGSAILQELGLNPPESGSASSGRAPVKTAPASANWNHPTAGRIALNCQLTTVAGGEFSVLTLAPVAAGEPYCDIETNFRAILETITDGVIVIDEYGMVELVNPAAERLFGFGREEIVGHNISMLMPSPDRENHDGYLANYRRTGIKKIIGIGREVSGRHKDGTVFPMYLSIGELVLAGKLLFVGILHDLTARKLTEDKLLVLSRAVDQSPVSIMITGPDGRIEYVNQGFTRLTGYLPAEVVGRKPSFVRSQDGSANGMHGLSQCVSGGEQWHGEIQGRRKDGSEFWALETVTSIRDATDRISRCLAMQQDITQQKHDQDALRESETRFRQVSETVGEWLWEQDVAGCYTYSSSAVREILGYTPEEILGKPYVDLLTEEDRAVWQAALPLPEQNAKPFRKLINHYRHRDGHEVYTESSGAPVLNEAGKVVKWRGIDHDITDRKRYEDAVRLRDRAIEEANVGIAVADARRRDYPNIYVNPALCRMTGYSQEELIGRGMNMLQGPDTDPSAQEAIRAALQQGGSCDVELLNYRKDGTEFWNELLLSPVSDENGKLTHYIGIQTDVTERRRAEAERHELGIARQIQLSLLPKEPLIQPGIEISGICVPATHVGGDYFDFFKCGDTVDMVIADVSGHSVGAALIMTETRSTLKAELRRGRLGGYPGPASILGLLNEALYSDLTGAELFITMFYLRYDPRTRRLRYASAGHNKPLLLRAAASGCEELDAEGLIMGVNPQVEFEERETLLQRGDVLLIYTDGVVEAQNEQDEFYGEDALCRTFRACRGSKPENLVASVMSNARGFIGRGHFQDDVTLVAAKIS